MTNKTHKIVILIRIIVWNSYKIFKTLFKKFFIILFFVAKKYLVYPLIRYCDEFLYNNLNDENVFSFLQYTIDCEANSKLKEKCVEIISTKTKGLLKSDEFLKISSQCLMFLLDQDGLSVSEAELFNAVSSSS